MTLSARSTYLAFAFLSVALGACQRGAGEVTDTTHGALSAPIKLKCSTLTVSSGAIGGGQTAAALGTRDQSGTADDWAKYVEVAPQSSITCAFALPAGTDPSQVRTLALETNYRGPNGASMMWVFEAFEPATATWRPVGDNSFASDWTWSPHTFDLAPAGLFDGGALQIRYRTDSNADASQLDELVVLATTGTASTPAPAPTPAPTTTTTAPPPPPPPPGTRWAPTPGTSWQWQISGTVDTTVNASVYDIDLFNSAPSLIADLHANGRKVVCYFDVAYEPYRPDASKYTAEVLGNVMDGWPDEKWVDIRSQVVRDIMTARMDLAVQQKCDAIEVDDIDVYANNSGFPITAADNLAFARTMATEAHARGLSIALKNDVGQVNDLVADFDFAVNEQCFKYNECDTLKPFIAAGKAVFHVEYGTATTATDICPKANALNFDSLVKNLALDAWRISCR